MYTTMLWGVGVDGSEKHCHNTALVGIWGYAFTKLGQQAFLAERLHIVYTYRIPRLKSPVFYLLMSSWLISVGCAVDITRKFTSRLKPPYMTCFMGFDITSTLLIICMQAALDGSLTVAFVVPLYRNKFKGTRAVARRSIIASVINFVGILGGFLYIPIIGNEVRAWVMWLAVLFEVTLNACVIFAITNMAPPKHTTESAPVSFGRTIDSKMTIGGAEVLTLDLGFTTVELEDLEPGQREYEKGEDGKVDGVAAHHPTISCPIMYSTMLWGVGVEGSEKHCHTAALVGIWGYVFTKFGQQAFLAERLHIVYTFQTSRIKSPVFYLMITVWLITLGCAIEVTINFTSRLHSPYHRCFAGFDVLSTSLILGMQAFLDGSLTAAFAIPIYRNRFPEAKALAFRSVVASVLNLVGTLGGFLYLPLIGNEVRLWMMWLAVLFEVTLNACVIFAITNIPIPKPRFSSSASDLASIGHIPETKGALGGMDTWSLEAENRGEMDEEADRSHGPGVWGRLKAGALPQDGAVQRSNWRILQVKWVAGPEVCPHPPQYPIFRVDCELKMDGRMRPGAHLRGKEPRSFAFLSHPDLVTSSQADERPTMDSLIQAVSERDILYLLFHLQALRADPEYDPSHLSVARHSEINLTALQTAIIASNPQARSSRSLTRSDSDRATRIRRLALQILLFAGAKADEPIHRDETARMRAELLKDEVALEVFEEWKLHNGGKCENSLSACWGETARNLLASQIDYDLEQWLRENDLDVVNIEEDAEMNEEEEKIEALPVGPAASSASSSTSHAQHALSTRQTTESAALSAENVDLPKRSELGGEVEKGSSDVEAMGIEQEEAGQLLGGKAVLSRAQDSSSPVHIDTSPPPPHRQPPAPAPHYSASPTLKVHPHPSLSRSERVEAPSPIPVPALRASVVDSFASTSDTTRTQAAAPLFREGTSSSTSVINISSSSSSDKNDGDDNAPRRDRASPRQLKVHPDRMHLQLRATSSSPLAKSSPNDHFPRKSLNGASSTEVTTRSFAEKLPLSAGHSHELTTKILSPPYPSPSNPPQFPRSFNQEVRQITSRPSTPLPSFGDNHGDQDSSYRSPTLFISNLPASLTTFMLTDRLKQLLGEHIWTQEILDIHVQSHGRGKSSYAFIYLSSNVERSNVDHIIRRLHRTRPFANEVGHDAGWIGVKRYGPSSKDRWSSTGEAGLYGESRARSRSRHHTPARSESTVAWNRFSKDYSSAFEETRGRRDIRSFSSDDRWARPQSQRLRTRRGSPIDRYFSNGLNHQRSDETRQNHLSSLKPPGGGAKSRAHSPVERRRDGERRSRANTPRRNFEHGVDNEMTQVDFTDENAERGRKRQRSSTYFPSPSPDDRPAKREVSNKSRPPSRARSRSKFRNEARPHISRPVSSLSQFGHVNRPSQDHTFKVPFQHAFGGKHSRTDRVTVDFGFVSQSVAEHALNAPAQFSDPNEQLQYEIFLNGQLGGTEHFLCFYAGLEEFNERNRRFEIAAKEASGGWEHCMV
ncbi:hypothetical protein P7C70_g5374, partial [Phenoliferia sp. Uapishka_3]